MTLQAFIEHYIEYITNPKVVVTLVVVVAPILFLAVAEGKLVQSQDERNIVPGCFSLGLSRKSNLYSSIASESQQHTKPRLAALYVYPLHACRGVELGASQVEQLGTKYDRLFALGRREYDGESGETRWVMLTEANCPQLNQLKLELWIPRPPERIPKSTKQRNASDARQNRDSSRPRGNTQVGLLERGGKPIPRPIGGYFAENGGCLVVKWQHRPRRSLWGLRTEPVVLQIPLRPSAERAELKQYSRDTMIAGSVTLDVLNMTAEIEPKKLEKLKELIDTVNSLGLFHIKRPLTSENKEEYVTYSSSIAVASCTTLREVSKEPQPRMRTNNSTVEYQPDIRANLFVSGASQLQIGAWKSITVGRRLVRMPNGLFETDGEYIQDPNGGTSGRFAENTVHFTPMFEQGILRVGDDIKVN